MNEYVSRAKEIISEISYVTIATVDAQGQPWNAPVYSAFDEDYNFYWASPVEAQHSKNITENENVFLVIYDSRVPEGTGEGVYVKAKAAVLADEKEMAKAIELLYSRKKKPPRPLKYFAEGQSIRIYKAMSEKFWINVTLEISGKFVDERVEIKRI